MCITRYCYSKSSVRLSLRLSVTLMYHGRISWVSSKVGLIARLISSSEYKTGSLVQGNVAKIWVEYESIVAILNRKPAISLKRGKIGPRLLLMNNRKLHTRFPLVSKSVTLDDLERPLQCTKHAYFEAYKENLNETNTIVTE